MQGCYGVYNYVADQLKIKTSLKHFNKLPKNGNFEINEKNGTKYINFTWKLF